MAYTADDGRQQLLDALAEAIDEIGIALASLSAAYEQLDLTTADMLEEELFGPVQLAYGRARRTHAAFAERHDLPGRVFESQSAGVPSTGAKGFIDNAVAAVSAAGGTLATLQDSSTLLEVGDIELRQGLTEVRELIGDLPHRARELLRRLGR
jgi:nitrate reductase assembly molybdenum cofactor insertion protein NarJ